MNYFLRRVIGKMVNCGMAVRTEAYLNELRREGPDGKNLYIGSN